MLDYTIYTDSMAEIYLTVKEASERLGVSRQRVHELIQLGRLKAIKAEREWRVLEESVTRFQPQRGGRPKRPRGRPKKNSI